MNHIFRPRTLAVLSLLALSAPAARAQRARSGDRAAVLLSSRPPAREHGCRIENRPNPLPSVDALVDSAALDAQIRQYSRAQHVTAGDTLHLLMSLGYDGGGNPERSHAIEWFLPEGGAGVLGPQVRAAMRKQRGGANVRLRIDLGEQPTYRVGRAEICEPMGLVRVSIQAPAIEQVERPRPVRVRVMVGAHGEMLGSTLLGSSGQPYWDDLVNRFINDTRYSPGLIDGEPQPMEYEQTVQFQAH
jgi:TonB family protein